MKRSLILFILWIISATLCYSNTENCTYTAGICGKQNNVYKIHTNYTPYKINWYESTQLVKSVTHRYRDSFTILIDQQNLPYEPLYEKSLVNSDWNRFQIQDSFYYNTFYFGNDPIPTASVKRRQMYHDSINRNLGVVDRGTSASYYKHFSLTNKKDNMLYYMASENDYFDFFLVYKFSDSIRPYTPAIVDTLKYLEWGACQNYYYYRSACMDFKRNCVYALKTSKVSSDTTMYVEKIDLNANTRTPLFNFKVSSTYTKYHQDILIFNDKIYTKYYDRKILEYDIKTGIKRILSVHFTPMPTYEYNYIELYVDSYGYMYYINENKLQKHDMVQDTVSFIMKDIVHKGNHPILLNHLDADCSGNLFLYENYQLKRATTYIDDTITSNSKDLTAVVYFWNGDSLVIKPNLLSITDTCANTTTKAFVTCHNARSTKLTFLDPAKQPIKSILNDTLTYSFTKTGTYYVQSIYTYPFTSDTFLDSFHIIGRENTIDTITFCNRNYTLNAPIVTGCPFLQWKETADTSITQKIKTDTIRTAQYKTVESCPFQYSFQLQYIPYEIRSDKYVCDSIIWFNTVYKTSGLYSHLISSMMDCDTLYKLNLNLKNDTKDTTKISSCSSYRWQDSVYTKTGLFTKILKTAEGCDSIKYLDLKIGLNKKVSIQNGINYTALQDSVSYQWYRCHPWRKITNETKKTFSTTTKGSYAVELRSKDGCIDTSDCIELYSNSISNQNYSEEMSLYPNPTRNNIYIDLKRMYRDIEIQVYDVSGRIIFTSTYSHTNSIDMNVSNLTQGVYYIQIVTEESSQYLNFMKE